ncbi:hypothetical protein BSL78_21983 [Apostichopus japonicus]|uniref:Uncharacterized protein n=1 Tax=Stichopus japonicus TaxID=307972 RepID=A0A2G8JZL9_STIJA|nr:hypothetical protein BSL78_21983 [Apostichopus japonicus]
MTSAVVVKPLTEDALAHPDSFTEVWNDRGSGGPLAVRFFTMNPRSGYTCLGSVALDNYQTPSPDKNLYRCVKSDYVSRGQGYYSLIWIDRGSGCPKAVIIYGNIPSGNSGYDIESNTFTAIGNYNTLTGSPPMLNGQVVKNHQEVLGLASLEDLAFVVYQTPDMEFVWSDRMTGCYLDIAVYRSKGHSGTYSLGDVAARSTNGKPEVGYVVKPLKDDALVAPDDYREIWNDKGTGGEFDVTFYQTICPSGYVALGDVAVASYTEDPPVDAIRCVKLDYVTNGQCDFVWNDRGSGSPDSLTVLGSKVYSGIKRTRSGSDYDISQLFRYA